MTQGTLHIANAAGTCKTLEDVSAFSKSLLTDVTLGSITWDESPGNSGNVLWHDPDDVYSLNSLGLPNGGAEYYSTVLKEMSHIVKSRGKALRISVSPKKVEDLEKLLLFAGDWADTIEINVSCPNVVNGTQQDDMVGFDPAACQRYGEIVRHVKKQFLIRPQFHVKVPPYSNPADIPRMARALEWTDALVACNTFPNGYAIENGKPVITPNGGLAGVSGRAMKPIAMGQVVQFRRALPDKKIFGVGGIQTGKDVKDFLCAGADGVQVNTHITKHLPRLRVIEEIATHYLDLI